MSRPRIAVVVCTHNREDRLRGLFAALRAQDVPEGDWELLVVDDGSTDGTPEVLAEVAAAGDLPLRVHRMENAGPSVARDEGWRRTSAPLVAFTDDDCEPAPDWLSTLLEHHDAQPEAVVQGRTEPIPREVGLLGPNSRTQRVQRCGPYFQTCNIAYPRTWLERVDGFDRSFGWGGEDCDLAWRCIEAGAKVRWAPEALVHHAVVQLGGRAYLRQSQRFTDSMRLYRRHPGLRGVALTWSVFYKASHQLLLQSLIGVLLARRHPAWLLLTYPYLKQLERRWAGSPQWAPMIVAHDVLEVGATVRGAIRHRTVVL